MKIFLPTFVEWISKHKVNILYLRFDDRYSDNIRKNIIYSAIFVEVIIL